MTTVPSPPPQKKNWTKRIWLHKQSLQKGKYVINSRLSKVLAGVELLWSGLWLFRYLEHLNFTACCPMWVHTSTLQCATNAPFYSDLGGLGHTYIFITWWLKGHDGFMYQWTMTQHGYIKMTLNAMGFIGASSLLQALRNQVMCKRGQEDVCTRSKYLMPEHRYLLCHSDIWGYIVWSLFEQADRDTKIIGEGEINHLTFLLIS